MRITLRTPWGSQTEQLPEQSRSPHRPQRILSRSVQLQAQQASTYNTAQENVKRRICRKNLSYVYKALKSYQDNFGRSAQGLGELVEGNFLNEINRKCPAAMDKEVGYFYFPILIPPKPGSDQLLMCDFSSNRKAEGRMVLFTNNLARWYSNEGFKRIVSLEQNTAFAEALVEAEGR